VSEAAPRGYHHGDLRNALILAAAELIAESGSLHFAMSDAARRAGVSAAAPYRHFRDRDALLEAVTQLAFLGLAQVAQAAVARTPPGSAESILELGRSYLAYVTERPAFYDLMWGDVGSRAMDAEHFDRATSGFYHLTGAVKAYLQARDLESVDSRDTAVKLWALVHGFSALAMSGKLELLHPTADVRALLESATHSFLAGL